MMVSFLISTVAQVAILAIVARSLLSWFPGVRTLAPVTAALNQATDPLLRPIQQRLRPVSGFDFSPIVAIVLIVVLESLLLGLAGGH